ncbi:hybrid sensor histidine kinase/response regulator transcription factor [Flavobacterium seoulense]|uniref:histidine kinase n=1 Tax=Flavobacterium seoulense TaxID=1492738 RepID=A0A066WSB6_9FLAO|nr:hybrid sensor histidine kinase/response regulator transcription factor [Flavobacterium seoulense]KDN56701.1 histidine kinase [Flavobacterium seoulense]
MIFFSKKSYYNIIGLLFSLLIFSQENNYTFEHYLVEDGLPHNIVNHIIQDKKGFMWFATTNGLSKYNGYSFQNYKTENTDKVLMKNNRIDWIVEDTYGRIWMKALANKNKTYCFDPSTESFWGTELIPNLSKTNFDINQIIPQKSGLVWLTSKKEGCIVITNRSYSNKIYNTQNHSLNTNIVNNVFEDNQKNSWLLTDRGINCIPINKINSKSYYLLDENKKTNSFYSAIELKDEIWFGGSNSTLVKYTKGTQNYRTQNLEIDGNIIIIKKIDSSNIVAITDKNTFCLINIFTGQVSKYSPPNLTGLKINIIKLTQDLLWFISNDDSGIYSINIKTKKLSYYPVANTEITSAQFSPKPIVLTDPKGGIWVQPNNGSFSKYDPATNRLIPFTTTNYFPIGNISNKFHTAYFDKQGNLWYNTRTSGIIKVVFSQNNFKSLQINNLNLNQELKDVRAIFQDKQKNIWVANKQNQLILLDKNLKKIGHLSPNGQLENNAVWSKPVYSIIEDAKSNIWIGTRGAGLYKFVAQNNSYSYNVTHYKNDVTKPYSLSDDNIYSIFEDQSKNIWVGTLNGLNLMTNRDSNLLFVNQNNSWKNTAIAKLPHVRCIKQDKNGLLYIGSTTGLLVFDGKKTITNAVKNAQVYERTKQNSNCLQSNDIIDFCMTKKGGIFIATADGGISKILTKNKNGFPLEFKNYTQKEGLASNNILSILEDNDQNIWITTDYLLTRFNPKAELFEVYSEVKPLISYKNFTEATRIKLDSGELFFGYSEGLLHFFPNQIKSNNSVPYLAFTDFQVYNQNSNNDAFHLSYPIDNNPSIELNHNQNFFNIEFAALDYITPKNIKYAYKLEGFDENWNYVNNQRTAFYTNVPKGTYTFKVKSTNSQGNWVNNERALTITVAPSIWNSTLSYIIYTVLIIGCIMLINYIVITFYRLKTNAQLEKDIFNMKQKFFIDISHELRTPLTLITGPIEYLINDNRTPEVIKNQLSYVSQSTSRLQRLVNQILDFRKIQDQKMQVSELNLTAFTNDLFNNFLETAQDRNIKYEFEVEGEDIKLWADKNALEKIILNLLSNAFKYTPDGKSVIVRITKNSKQIILQVIDEGIGIAEDHHHSIFNRFASFNKNNNNPSTGIGLSMVKELVEKHHGEVNFISKTNIGSTFSIYFKTGNSHFNEDVEIIYDETLEITENNSNTTANDKIENNLNSAQEKTKVLVVEDDLNLRTFLKNVLDDDYEVIEAEDGEIGYQKILENTPDFIISDIMMPKLDGVELLKKIRNNIETSHVPVILLTAKTTIESKLEGLSYGADDYITKPFSVAYLKARITNLLEQRKRLQGIFESYEKEDTKEPNVKEYNPKPYLITDQDEEIMQKIMLSIEENMDNNEFSVEDLGSIIGLNRTTFYYKIKSLTGFSPVEFIRDVRIKRAAQLLANSQLLIKEIAYMTGFSDMKYFTKSFKNKYNLTPTEYRQKHKE